MGEDGEGKGKGNQRVERGRERLVESERDRIPVFLCSHKLLF